MYMYWLISVIAFMSFMSFVLFMSLKAPDVAQRRLEKGASSRRIFTAH